jgi:starch-binding outer membrane protein, SusD/RagB family
MRHILYTFLLIAVVSSSCHKQVQDIDPQNLLYSELAYSTPEKIEANVIAAYDGLQSKDFLSGRALIYVDLLGEDIYDRINFFTELPRYNLLSNSGIVSGVWTAGYDAIARANRAIAGVTGNSSKLTGTKAKEFIAECKFVRAVANFYLVNFFAQPYGFTADASHIGIPIITKSFTYNDPEANQPRSTVAEVYAVIIKDLTEALADLPQAYTGYANNTYHTKTRGTKAAASAFLSRVYLYKADYANAKKFAKDVIDGLYGTYALTTNVNTVFVSGASQYQNTETIWSIPNNITDNPTSNVSLSQHYSPTSRADLAVSSIFLDETKNKYFPADDKRRVLIVKGTGPLAAIPFTGKYTSLTDWAPIMRFAEILLTYAEAQTRAATAIDADAIAKLNLVRDRARGSQPSYTVASFNNKDELIDAILGERHVELAFEGHRFWDLMRVKATVKNKFESDGINLMPEQPFGSLKNIFPIPQLEVDKSKKVLAQNQGY